MRNRRHQFIPFPVREVLKIGLLFEEKKKTEERK